MNEDLIPFEHFPGDQSLARRARVKAQKVLYYFLTGYWNTGERLHPFFVTNNYVNHLRVYQYISQFTAGGQVLDVGCGVGYGTALLARTAARAVGIDISQKAVNEAFRLYPAGEFLRMDAENMTFPDQSFDVIVSTEISSICQTRRSTCGSWRGWFVRMASASSQRRTRSFLLGRTIRTTRRRIPTRS